MSQRYPGIPAAAAYSETFPWDGRLHERNRAFARAGARLFFPVVLGGFGGDPGTTWFWRGDAWGDEADRGDGLALDDQAREILAEAPQARLIVRWMAGPPPAWCAAHPEQVQRRADGVACAEGSFASASYRQALADLARRVVAWCESRPWAAAIAGYAAFPPGEGLALHAIEGSCDHSPAMRAACAAHLRRRYGDLAALRAAWGVADAGFDDFPDDPAWQARRAGWRHWPDPAAAAPLADLLACHRACYLETHRAQLRAIKAAAPSRLAGLDGCKQTMLGWLLRDHFADAAGGARTPSAHALSGAAGLAELLDEPALDFLITPADYHARAVGWGFEPEGIGDALVLRRKIMLVEDDTRTWASPERTTQGAWRDESEMRAGMLRDLGLAAARGHCAYWMNVGRGGFFDHPAIMAEVAAQAPLRERLAARPWRDTEHAIALLIDDASTLDEDLSSGYHHTAVLRQRLDELALTGLPWRVHLFDDLRRGDLPHYRCWLLPDCFRLDAGRIALIRERLCRRGSVVVLGPGTGISNGVRLAADGLAALTGARFELVAAERARRVLVAPGAHPALAGLPHPLVYGSDLPFGPLLLPAAGLARGQELGRLSAGWQGDAAGLAWFPRGRGAGPDGGEEDGAFAFSAAVPLPAALLRSFALHAGCVPWAPLGDVVGACDDLLCLHTLAAGPRTVRLPRPYAVRDAIDGRLLAGRTDRFELDCAGPGTRLLMLDHPA